jgi:multidrug efflux pump subunit AcrA (membrane-fusion protein)
MASIQPGPKPQRGRRRGKPWLFAGLFLLIAGVYSYIERPWEPRPAIVAVEVMAEGPHVQVLAVNGRFAALHAIKVRATVTGQAIEVRAEEGASVSAGDVLVQLDTAQPMALLDQDRAALDAGLVRQQQAQANVDRARALGENATRSVREGAELALSAAGNDVSRLRAAVDQAQSQLAHTPSPLPLMASCSIALWIAASLSILRPSCSLLPICGDCSWRPMWTRFIHRAYAPD